MDFQLLATAQGSAARAGEITTAHGTIQTPVFMPVGTVGSVKAVHRHELTDDIDAQIILGNTYHLYLRPGTELLRKAGGLHGFMGWKRPILTDSGGFQVFSLSANRKLKEEGAWFRSHIDGSKHLFTPENVVDIERIIGADIMMALDECPPGDSDFSYARKSLDLTHRWLKRGWERYRNTEGLYGYSQAYFPIVQGCTYPELRRESVQEICEALEEYRQRIFSNFLVPGTAVLYHNGKINGTIHRLCTSLNLHPILAMSKNKLKLWGIESGNIHRVNRQYVKKLLKHSKQIDSRILFVTYAGCSVRQIDEILAEVEKYMTFERIILQKASATVSCNCGAGTLGLMFIKKPGDKTTSDINWKLW